jgi:hypothetical protein
VANLLTATVENQFAHVILRSEFSATGSLTALVERSIDGGVTWTAVRGGNRLTLVGPAPGAGNRVGYLYDSEMPLDTAVRYRSTDNLGTVTTAGPVTVVSSGYAWLKDPAREWANVRIDDCTGTAVPTKCSTPLTEPAVTLVADGLGTEEYGGDFTLFPVLNRPRPNDVYAYRKDAVTDWTVVSKTLTSMRTLNTFYAWGGPILLQLPAVYGWADRYYQPGNVREERLSKDLRVPYRRWPVPLTVIDNFPGAAQGTCENNWCIIDSTYATWAALTATGFTWGQIVEGAAATC